MELDDIIVIKPLTYMNLSGDAVIAVMNFYKIDKKDILIIYDDISLDIGRVRFRNSGSDGGHNGIKSIISNLGTEFIRIKCGISRPSGKDPVNYVLGKFTEEERNILKDNGEKINNLIDDIIEEKDINKLMSVYNQK